VVKKNDVYLKQISQIWEIKEKIYHETKKMDFKQYTEYLKGNIKELKERFKAKYTTIP
jgi:hypothetical protein